MSFWHLNDKSVVASGRVQLKAHIENYCKKPSRVRGLNTGINYAWNLIKMLHPRKILLPDVPPPRFQPISIGWGAVVAGVGLCGLTGFIVVILLAL